MSARLTPFVFTIALACASEEVAPRTSFDDSKGLAVVAAIGGEFVQLDGARMPLDEAIVRLRLRTRELSRDDLRQRFVVQLLATPSGDDAMDRSIRAQLERLLDELRIMGVKQVRYL